MSDNLAFDMELQALRQRAVDRLMSAEVFDSPAFDALLQYLNGKAAILRGEYAIPKQVLACLRDAAGAIRSRAEYVPAVKPHVEMAAKFDLLLDLMIMGETLDDRAAPRAV